MGEEVKEQLLLPEPKCEHCDDTKDVSTGHNGYAYIEDRRNYSTLCKDCWIEMNEEVRERWSDFYHDKF